MGIFWLMIESYEQISTTFYNLVSFNSLGYSNSEFQVPDVTKTPPFINQNKGVILCLISMDFTNFCISLITIVICSFDISVTPYFKMNFHNFIFQREILYFRALVISIQNFCIFINVDLLNPLRSCDIYVYHDS